MSSNAKQRLLILLRAIGSPLAPNKLQKNDYVPELYSIAEVNKMPLTYLNTVSLEGD